MFSQDKLWKKLMQVYTVVIEDGRKTVVAGCGVFVAHPTLGVAYLQKRASTVSSIYLFLLQLPAYLRMLTSSRQKLKRSFLVLRKRSSK